MHLFATCSSEVSGPRCNSRKWRYQAHGKGRLNISEAVPRGTKLTGNGRNSQLGDESA